jgi:hypothetical protein
MTATFFIYFFHFQKGGGVLVPLIVQSIHSMVDAKYPAGGGGGSPIGHGQIAVVGINGLDNGIRKVATLSPGPAYSTESSLQVYGYVGTHRGNWELAINILFDATVQTLI